MLASSHRYKSQNFVGWSVFVDLCSWVHCRTAFGCPCSVSADSQEFGRSLASCSTTCKVCCRTWSQSAEDTSVTLLQHTVIFRSHQVKLISFCCLSLLTSLFIWTTLISAALCLNLCFNVLFKGTKSCCTLLYTAGVKRPCSTFAAEALNVMVRNMVFNFRV